MFLGGATAFLLDNTIPGTAEERGLAKWRKTEEEEEEEEEEKERKKKRPRGEEEEGEGEIGGVERTALELKEIQEIEKGIPQNQDSIVNLVGAEHGVVMEDGVDGGGDKGSDGYVNARDGIRPRGGFSTYDLPFCTNFLVRWSKYTKYLPISPTYKR